MFPILLLLSAITVPLKTEVFHTTDLSKVPAGHVVKSITYCAQGVWFPFTEGNAFSGSNEQCEQEALRNRSDGWTFVPPVKTALPWNEATWYNVTGQCRLLRASETEKFYLYANGLKWAMRVEHLEKGQEPYCPTTKPATYVGVKVTTSGTGKLGYSQPAPMGQSSFCLKQGQINSACNGIPLTVSPGGIFFNDNTKLGDQPLFCSKIRNGCGAVVPLFERYHKISFEYAVAKKDNTWVQKCWVWPGQHC